MRSEAWHQLTHSVVVKARPEGARVPMGSNGHACDGPSLSQGISRCQYIMRDCARSLQDAGHALAHAAEKVLLNGAVAGAFEQTWCASDTDDQLLPNAQSAMETVWMINSCAMYPDK